MKRRNYRSYRNKKKQAFWVRDIAIVAVLVVVLFVIVSQSCGKREEDPAKTPSSTTTTTSTTTSATTTTTTSATTTTTTTTQSTTEAQTTTKTTTSSTKTTTGTTVAVEGHYVQADRTQWDLLLVNAWNPISEEYEQGVSMKEHRSTDKYFDARALEALEQMMKDAKGCGLWLVSGYRSRATQTRLFKNKVQRLKNGGYTGSDVEDKAATVVARPGTSEHQTGLAADILGSGYSKLTEGFDDTKAFKWLKENCAKYGFILRYPKNKEHITGVIYEPWHYRYVGVEHAQKIMEQGICLEEYLEQIGR